MSRKNRNLANRPLADAPTHSQYAAGPVGDCESTLDVWNKVLLGGLLLWTFLSLCFPLMDTDFWWHLKTGDWILHEGKIPQVDLYTFTEVGKPWIDLHWGFQVLISLLYRAGGVNLVILAKAAVITAAVAVAWCAGGRALPAWKK